MLNTQSTRPANQMTLLLNKIERRLGLKVLTLPEGLTKDNWAEVIILVKKMDSSL